jgi:glycosyltransferase involved in cell wall biosynthesis
MNILIICHEFPPFGGGAASVTFYLAKYLSLNNHKITILTSRFKKLNELIFAANIIYLPVLRRYSDRTSPLELLSFALSAILYGLFFIRRRKYDICLAIHGIPSGWVALFIYKIFKIPYIISLVGGDVPGFLPQSYDNLHRRIQFLTDFYWRNAKSLITNSRGLKEIAKVTADRIKRNVKIISNGVDCRVFEPEYNLRDNKTIKIIYIGRITLQKNLEYLVKTVAKVYKEAAKTFKLEIIGNGPLKNYLQDISQDLCSKGIIDFSDRLDKSNSLLRYKKAHIFILPSLYEGMSSALLEAMACGCMIIASDVAGNNELVKNGYNGFLFNPRDCAQLEEALIKTLNSGWETIEAMGRKSRLIAQNYDWSKVAEKYANHCNDIVRKRI